MIEFLIECLCVCDRGRLLAFEYVFSNLIGTSMYFYHLTAI